MREIDVNALPILLKIPQAVKVSGVSRSELYLRKKAGKLQCKHVGRAMYVVTESLLKMVQNLPD